MIQFKKPTRKAVILSLIALLLVAAIVTLSILLGFATARANDPFSSYYDKKCFVFEAENANFAKGQIVFIGDSITDGYVLDASYGDLPLATYNRGIGGDTTAGVLDRLEGSVFDLAPSKIVLMIGTNDVWRGEESKDILKRYEKILKKITKELPDTELYCMSIIPQHETESLSAEHIARTTAQILEVNPEIKALAEEYGATYVDIFGALADENNRLCLAYSDDGIHLTAAGYAVWTAHLKPYLQ